jgi:hypothetical protein
MSFWGARRALVIGPTGWSAQVYRTDQNSGGASSTKTVSLLKAALLFAIRPLSIRAP